MASFQFLFAPFSSEPGEGKPTALILDALHMQSPCTAMAIRWCRMHPAFFFWQRIMPNCPVRVPETPSGRTGCYAVAALLCTRTGSLGLERGRG